MIPQSPGYLLKLDRGKAHRTCLDKMVKRWVKSNCRPIRKFDPQAGEHVVRALIAKQLPVDLPLLIGDCAHNMRAALDYLAYQLATDYTHTLSGRQLQSIEFPIFTDPAAFGRTTREGTPARGSGLAKLQFADPAVYPLIQAMQPYNGGEWELLAILHELDRIDKHRKLNLSVAMSREIQVDCGDNARLQHFTFDPPGRIEHNDVLCRFGCVHKRGHKGKVKPRVDVSFSVALAEGFKPWSVPIVEELGRIDRLIRHQIIPTLTPYL